MRRYHSAPTEPPLPAGSLLTLLDDIASVLDDVATMTKVAATKTAGVLGDDLALNAQQVTGVRADRELPVVWAVARGSLINKAILVPAALAISALAPWAVMPLLMIGGAYLCYEGCEKVAHKLLHDAKAEAAHHAAAVQALVDPAGDPVAVEREKIKGAVRTDFILSAEIIVISLGTVADQSFGMRVAVLVGIALLMTLGVYGLVAAIVKLDDLGLLLARAQGPSSSARTRRAVGNGVLRAAPWMMKALSVLGTAAMFLVGGGIVAHGIPPVEHWLHGLEESLAGIPLAGFLATSLAAGGIGIAVGGAILGAVALFKRR